MENTVKARLQSLQTGQPQVCRNIVVVPLITPADGAFRYQTLGDALTDGLTISEVSEGGSVPQLLVANRGSSPVLLVDGEELAGAKQNRVLNTSILLREGSQTKIPVSCTEQGRWSYSSPAFMASGNVMSFKSRSSKSRSVQRNLETSGLHSSNQGEVWDEIARLQAKAGLHSPTSAMHDVFQAFEGDLRQYDDTFTLLPGQVGLLVLMNGVPAGLDLVSLPAAYAKLHSKLIRSYTLEALLERGSAGPVAPADRVAEATRRFLDEITATEERQFPSIGYGTDFRYRSNGNAQRAGVPLDSQPATLKARPAGITGSALVHENEVIHAAFFRLDDPSTMNDPSATGMASFLRRRRHNYE